MNQAKICQKVDIHIIFELAMSKGSSLSLGSAFTISNFIIKEQIGSGKFGIVYRAIEKYSDKEVAIKIIPKRNINTPTEHKQLQREIQIQSRLKHPFICELYAYFHDSHTIYIVLEYCPHGSLDVPIKKLREVFSDKKIASLFEQLVQALAYMHERNVMHRDLKLQNILLDEFYNAKISDFGCCVHQTTPRQTFCGTMEYISPEMIKKEKYSNSIDIYCLGIILYELFYFQSPFIGKDEEDTFKKIREAEVFFDDSVRIIPEVAKKLIKDLLNKIPEERPKASELLNHEFIGDYLRDSQGKVKKERITEKQFKKWRESLSMEETAELVEKVNKPFNEIREEAAQNNKSEERVTE